MGAKGLRATSQKEFDEALAIAMKTDTPVVIDTIIGSDDKVWPMVAPGKPISECFDDKDLK